MPISLRRHTLIRCLLCRLFHERYDVSATLYRRVLYALTTAIAPTIALRQITICGPRSRREGPGHRTGAIRTSFRMSVTRTAVQFSLNPGYPERYLRKFEHYHPNPKHPGVDVSQHGQRGPMAGTYSCRLHIGTLVTRVRGRSVGHYGNFSDSSKRFIEACVNVGIPYTPDLNTPKGTLGISSVRAIIPYVGDYS